MLSNMEKLQPAWEELSIMKAPQGTKKPIAASEGALQGVRVPARDSQSSSDFRAWASPLCWIRTVTNALSIQRRIRKTQIK